MSSIQASKTGAAFMEEIRRTLAPNGTVAVWPTGQASVIIKGGATTVWIDPYVSDYVERSGGPARSYPAPIAPEDIDQADYCLITHEHDDHLDPITIEAIVSQNERVLFVGPPCCKELLLKAGVKAAQYIPAVTDQWIELDAVKIKPIAAAHEQLELDQSGHHRYVGYIVTLNGVTVYHSGDSTVYPGMAEALKQENIDLGMLPINGRDAFRLARGIVGNMNIQEAAELAYTAGMDTVIPLHYDLFEGNQERPGVFVDYLYERFPSQKAHVLARGERFVYVSPSLFLA